MIYLCAGIEASGNLLFLFPTYTFKQPVLGGQAAFGLGWPAAHMRASGTITITGPQGNTVTQKRTDAVTGGSNLYGLGTLK